MKKGLQLYILLLILGFSSCRLGSFKDLKKTKNKIPITALSTPVEKAKTTKIFKSTLSYKAHKFSGLLAIKHFDNKTIRITLTPQIGPKIFDFEIDSLNQFQIHYCMELLNRKLLLKVIEKDLRLLLNKDLTKKTANVFVSSDTTKTIYKAASKKNFNYFFYKNNKIESIQKATKLGRKKVVMTFENYKNDFPKNINIQHQNLPLRLELKTLKY